MSKQGSSSSLADGSNTPRSAPEDAFQCQLEFLKIELETINEITGRIDGTTAAIKNWCIGIWAGSIALALNSDKEQLIYFTTILPMLFWFVDAWWRRIQRSFIYRSQKISEFLNSDLLVKSFKQRKLVEFTVLDPKGRQYANDLEYKKFRSVLRTLRFWDVGVFYLGLSVISLVAALAVVDGG